MVLSVGLFSSGQLITKSKKPTKISPKELKGKFKKFYELTYYIAAEEEKDTFLKLKNSLERDKFINIFWTQRDPTPGTGINETKKEYEKRFAYVNKYFRIGAGKPGWMTDRGEFYMILGKPNSIDRFESKMGVYPARVWYYYGDIKLGLPAHFNITFYRPNYTTDWKLYNPSLHGPQALIETSEPLDTSNPSQLFKIIQRNAPGLGMPALTMIPNQYGSNMGPSLRSNIVLANIYKSPIKIINVSYARNFLKYKGYVRMDSSLRMIDVARLITVSRYDRFDFSFINLSIKPKTISIGHDEATNQHFFNFEMNVSLKQGEKFVFSYKKNFEFYFSADEVRAIRGNGIVIHDSFPVIPGKYKLLVFIENTIGNESSFFEKDIIVPPSAGKPVLTDPVISYKSEIQKVGDPNIFFPYKINNQKIYVDPENTFRLKEKLMIFFGVYNIDRKFWETAKVKITLSGLSERNKFKQHYLISLKNYDFRENLNIIYKIDKDNLYSDYYEIDFKLLGKAGTIVDAKRSSFTIAPTMNVVYPKETFKKLRIENPYLYFYILGFQYKNTGKFEKARQSYEKCLNFKPDYHQGWVDLLNVLLIQKKYNRILVEVEKLSKSGRFEFDYHHIKGKALYEMNDFTKALDSLLKANKIYDSDIRVLNLIGFTLLNLRNYSDALDVFNASIKLNNKQSYILNTIKQIKARKGKKEVEK